MTSILIFNLELPFDPYRTQNGSLSAPLCTICTARYVLYITPFFCCRKQLVKINTCFYAIIVLGINDMTQTKNIVLNANFLMYSLFQKLMSFPGVDT